jgi:hypothetical protein
MENEIICMENKDICMENFGTDYGKFGRLPVPACPVPGPVWAGVNRKQDQTGLDGAGRGWSGPVGERNFPVSGTAGFIGISGISSYGK